MIFVDLVDSTSLLGANDPEVVRRRVTRYFDNAAEQIRRYGGTVEKFAGDAVMAAFGVPQTHEDDAERAIRAAFAVLDAVCDLGLEARIGIESGELVVEDVASTFATGEAVNAAARLQQSAAPGTIVLGPGARRLTVESVEVEDLGPVEVRPGEELWSWRAVRVLESRQRRPRARFVGREQELELLHNSYERTVRDRRATLVTVFGDPGVGKSRLVEEFTAGVERATVLTGRALPYGEGVACLADRVDGQGVGRDHRQRPGGGGVRETPRLLRERGRRRPARRRPRRPRGNRGHHRRNRDRVGLRFAGPSSSRDVQPLVLVFEDVQWADERMLDVIERLARSLREVADADRLRNPDRAARGASVLGRRQPAGASAIELAPLSADESAAARRRAAAAGEPPSAAGPCARAGRGQSALPRGNGAHAAGGQTATGVPNGIPDSVQALIAARIDLLGPREKRLLQHAAVIGRVFWRGALERLAPELATDGLLGTLRDRDFVCDVERSAIPGDSAFQFSHVLIRDVAYAGDDQGRARRESRAVRRLDRGARPRRPRRGPRPSPRPCLGVGRQLDSSVPPGLAGRTADALEHAGLLAHRRDAFANARRLFRRSIELEPTLERHFLAADAARGLNQVATVATEMERVRADAHTAGDAVLEGRALTALAEVAMARDGDPAAATRLAAEGLALLPESEVDARTDALRRLAAAAWWPGDLRQAELHTREAIAIADRSDRRDLWVRGMTTLQWLLELRLELGAAEDALTATLEHPGDSVIEQARAKHALGSLRRIQGRLEEARLELGGARDLFLDAGAAGDAAWSGVLLGWIDLVEGDATSAERAFREAVRIYAANEDHGHLCEAQRALAEVLLDAGKVDEAERHALAAHALVSAHDLTSRSSTMTTLGKVRAAQGRDADAEQLLRESLALLADTDYRLLEVAARIALTRFLRAAGRAAEASELEAGLPSRLPGWLGSEDALSVAAV